MANHVNIKAIADLIDEKPFNMNWFSYDLMGGWGSRLTKYSKKGAAQGITTPGISNETSIIKVYKKLKNNDFNEIAGFYVAILCFFGEKIYKNLEKVEKIPKNSINKVVSALQYPEKFANEIYEICHSKYDFIEFLKAANHLERTKFDLDSAISTYKLQGDAAIFSILCQIFYINKGIDSLHTSLIKDLPVTLPIEISDFLSGCNFPVAVSPSVTQLKWQENQNGWFLYGKYGEKWLVMDVAGVGRTNLSNYALTNRLNYLGGGGECLPYIICWNWGEIIEAYYNLGSDLLIRDLRNDLFSCYWFNFGLKSRLNVVFKDNLINGKGEFAISANIDTDLITKQSTYLTVDLEGNFINYCDKKDVFYSKSEVFDWFELGNYLK